ncbi:MAG: hypothetical protein FWC77_08285 [Defluviitaleaceae bacterium]|nr:hypothetical protein [Defluviitaleaceae bacterium]
MENNLKNRYIYAVTRHLPTKMQYDVERELDSLISEMLDERRGNNPASSQQDLKDVLAELGSPEELALKYGGNERKALISGVYFLMYKRVLITVLPIIAAVLAALTTIGFFVGDEPSLSIIIIGIVNVTYLSHAMQIFTVTIGGVVQAFAVITVVFAVLDYRKVEMQGGEFFDLPEIPIAKMKISPVEPVFWIAFSIVTTILLLGFPQVMGARFDGSWVTVFNIEVVRGLWLPILVWTLLEIIAEAVKLVEGQYNMRVAAVTVVACVLQIVCVVAVFGNSNIINPEVISRMESFGINVLNIGGQFNNLFIRPNLAIVVLIICILLWEIVEVVVKTFQAKQF